MGEAIFRQSVWWPTPILIVEHRDAIQLNQELAELILRKERDIVTSETPTPIAGVQIGLTAYWLKYNVLSWDHGACKTFRNMALSAIQEFIKTYGDPDDPGYRIAGISCWANVLRHGESLEIHHHDPGFVSAHYTVRNGHAPKTDIRDQGGQTVYYRPGFIDRSHGGDLLSGPWDDAWRTSMPATEGNMTVFPSYVRHEVKPYLGETERISIAMDVYLRKQKAPFHFAPPRWFVPR